MTWSAAKDPMIASGSRRSMKFGEVSSDAPVVAYGAAAVPETLGGAGVATRTDDPLEMARLLEALWRSPELRRELVDAQRARLAPLSQEAVARDVREGLRPFLEGVAVRAPPEPAPRGVALVCPGLLAFPEAPESRLALALARRLPEAHLLTLDPSPLPAQLAPRALRHEGLDVRAFTPDEPLPVEATRELPGSSALWTALRASHAPRVFLPAGARIARDVLPHPGADAWGVSDAAQAPPTAVRERLGARLLTFDSQRPEAVPPALIHALTS
mgnify:CR=1 FL=1